MTKEKEMKFETALKRLEQIVEKLESGQTDLDDSIKLFEEGTELVKFCSKKLEEVKRKVEILVKKEGKIVVEPFKEEIETERENYTTEPNTENNSKKTNKKEQEFKF